MRTLSTLVLIGVLAVPPAAQAQNRGAEAQGRNGARVQGVPPGPTNCDNAERIASRSRDARVVYGPILHGRNDRRNDGRDDRRKDGRWDPDDNRRDRGRQGVNAIQRVPFDIGYRDGFEKGREDARDNDDYDPVRHSWYRSGTRGYDNRYGQRDQYRIVYRDGFEAGYAEAYRGRIITRRR